MLDSEHTPVLGKKFIEGAIKEQSAIPKHDHNDPIVLNHNSPLISMITTNIKKLLSKYTMNDNDIQKILRF